MFWEVWNVVKILECFERQKDLKNMLKVLELCRHAGISRMFGEVKGNGKMT